MPLTLEIAVRNAAPPRRNSFQADDERAAAWATTFGQGTVFSLAHGEGGALSLKYTLLVLLIALAFFYLAGNFELAVLGVFSDVSSRLTI